MNFKEFISFDKMITPVIIKILFYIGIVICIILGLSELIGGIAAGSLSIIFLGLITIVIGPVLVKVYCELVMVLFKILENLKDINNKMQQIMYL